MTRIPVLNHGFVELVDIMGDDQAIVDAARVSVAGENVRTTSDNDTLIRYLYRNRHTTPFEMVETKWRAKMPVFVARQWVRHRTASINEMSGRYGELPDECYVPGVEHIVSQSTDNKQGRGANQLEHANEIQATMAGEQHAAHAVYQNYLQDGVARELARINLPVSTYTQWIWKIDLHNLFHFLALRMHPHAQYEIRVYAAAMASIIRQQVPLAYQAFEDYRLNTVSLSANEQAALRTILFKQGKVKDFLPNTRERVDFMKKVIKLGLVETIDE